MPFQPAALDMSLRDRPILFALEVEAAPVEWAEKTVKSIPASPRNNFTYLARVALWTGLCGYS